MLKSFIVTLYSILFNFSFYLLLALTFVSLSLFLSSLRMKFTYFIAAIILYAIWGFLFDLDGMMLVLLTTEFTITLLFLMTYIQLYSNYSFTSTKNPPLTFFLFLVVVLSVYTPIYTPMYYSNYYSASSHIVASDFYILYDFLFEKLPVLVILVTLIISFFSLFFIVLYYSLKLVKFTSNKRLKNLYFLRKQNLIKQTTFSTKIYTFQN